MPPPLTFTLREISFYFGWLPKKTRKPENKEKCDVVVV